MRNYIMTTFSAMCIAICLFPIGSKASTDDCSAVDYRSMVGAPRDQGAAGLGDSGLCFAFTSADLISQRVGYKVSAIDIATSFFFGASQNLRNVRAAEVQKYLRKHPAFQAALKTQRAGDSGGPGSAYDPDVMLGAKGIYDLGGDDEDAIIMANLKGLCPASDLADTEFGNLAQKAISLAKGNGQDVDTSEISRDPATQVTQPDSLVLAANFTALVDQACHRKPAGALIPVITAGAQSLDEFNVKYKRGSAERKSIDDTLFATLNWALSHGHIVGVDYNSDLIMPKDTEHDHASSVVARKKFGKECRYLIRNSFGSDCSENVLPEFQGQGLCENGNIWVNRAQLSDPGDFYSVTYLK